MSANVSAYSNARPVAPRALLWARRASRENVVVMTHSEIGVGTLSRKALATAREKLEAGLGPHEILGPKARYLSIVSVRSVSARLGRGDLLVAYEKQTGRVVTETIPLGGQEAQAEALVALRDRLGDELTIEKRTERRFLRAMKSFQFVVLFALLAGVFDHYARASYSPSEAGGRTDHALTTSPRYRPLSGTRLGAVAKLGYVHFGLTMVSGELLRRFGYRDTLLAFFTLSGAALVWTIARLISPPETIVVSRA